MADPLPAPRPVPSDRIRSCMAIVVLDGVRRYVNERLEIRHDETSEQFADRVRAKILEIMRSTP